LSGSDTSDISIDKSKYTDADDQLVTSQSILSDDKYWWNTQSSSDENDNNKEEKLKDGSTWLKSDTKLEVQDTVQSHGGHASQSAQNTTTKQPLMSPAALSASGRNSGGEDFTHDSLGMY